MKVDGRLERLPKIGQATQLKGRDKTGKPLRKSEEQGILKGMVESVKEVCAR